MFRFEKDMIPVLKEHLSRMFNTKYFLEEFSSGMGRADLVFTTKEFEQRNTLEDFEAMYYVINYFKSVNKNISLPEIAFKHNLKKDKLDSVIQYLKELDCVIEYEGGNVTIKQNYQPCLQDLISIEAKLGDWKKGFYQALRYKQYSHKSFLAISHKYLHRVDKELLKENNVGLIAVSPIEIEIIINPKKSNPINKTAYYYLSESFVSQIKRNSMLN